MIYSSNRSGAWSGDASGNLTVFRRLSFLAFFSGNCHAKTACGVNCVCCVWYPFYGSLNEIWSYYAFCIGF